MKTIKNHWKIGLILSLFAVGISSCCKDDEPEPQITKNSDKQIISFVFLSADNDSLNEDVVATVNEEAKTIAATLPSDVPLTALQPEIRVSDVATVSPVGAQNFTNPVTYSVTAEDGSKVNYAATVISKSSAKQIVRFVFLASKNPINTNIVATIDEGNKIITAAMPAGTDLTVLLPDIEISANATISPVSAQDFTGPLEYTVTAEDNSQVVYTVTVTEALSQRQILQGILDANPANTLGWDLQNTAQLGSLTEVTTNAQGNITELFLAGKNLSSLKSEIGQLTDLRYLDIDDNHFSVFPLSVTLITSLTGLSVDGNQLTDLPAELGKLINLNYLSLINNQLTTLPPEIGLLTGLTDLSLTTNNLITLPAEIGQLTLLENLFIVDNQIISLPPEIGQLTLLKVLSAVDNQLASLPPEIGQLKVLEKLYLSNNHLTTLPAEIGQLKQLHTLHLNINQITSLPSEIGGLTGLNSLNLINNNLSTLPAGIGQMIALTSLTINNNQITSLPSEIGQLSLLERLNINDNNLTDLPAEIGELTSLNDLQLNNNQLTSLPREIGQLTSLGLFTMSSNNLTALPAEIGLLTQLGSCSIMDNQISILPPEMGFLTKLVHLETRGNNLISIPQSVCNLVTFKNPGLNLLHDPGVTCKTVSVQDGLTGIYSANPGNTLGWGVDNYPGVTFWSDGSPRLIEIANKGIQRITGGVGTLATLRLLDVRNNPLGFIAPEVCKLEVPTGALTILTDPGEGCN